MCSALIAGYLLVLAGRMSGQLGVLYGIGARVGGWCWARLRKFAHPTSRDMANLRKYALETSPVADCENMHSAKIILSPYGSRPCDSHSIFCHHLHVRPRSTRHVSGDAAHGATHGVLCTTLRTAHPCGMHTRAQHPGGPWQQPTSHHPSIIERNQFWPPPACELISVRELGASSV